MQKDGPWRFLGLDESNNNQYPAIYVATFSNNETDTHISKRKRIGKTRKGHNKKRKGHRKITTMFTSRDYSFLFYSKADNKIIQPYKRIGIILASLVYNQPKMDFLKILIDGVWVDKNIDFAKSLLKDITGLEKERIEIITGPQLDKRNKLVNLADETAHWLYQQSLSNSVNNKHKKQILYNELSDYI
jgi:hypothetical protein